jgi:hypothetical protein
MTLSAVDAVKGPIASLGIELSTLSGLNERERHGRKREALTHRACRTWRGMGGSSLQTRSLRVCSESDSRRESTASAFKPA